MKIFSFGRFTAVILLAAVLGVASARAQEKLHGEALLVWGTDDEHSPDPKHIPVDAVLARKLSKSPYRWKYYFEVNRKDFALVPNEVKKNLVMSKHCTLDVKNLGDHRIEVTLYGEGKRVSVNKENFVDDWPLIFAGSAGNETAWLVVLRKTKPMDPNRSAELIPTNAEKAK